VISHHTRVLRYRIALALCTLADWIAPRLDEKTRIALTIVDIEEPFMRDPGMDRDTDHVSRAQARAPFSRRLHRDDIDEPIVGTNRDGTPPPQRVQVSTSPQATGSSLQRSTGSARRGAWTIATHRD
jgi:hypothetical protein